MTSKRKRRHSSRSSKKRKLCQSDDEYIEDDSVDSVYPPDSMFDEVYDEVLSTNYDKEFLALQEHCRTTFPCLDDILKANISLDLKLEALGAYISAGGYAPLSQDWIHSMKEVRHIIRPKRQSSKNDDEPLLQILAPTLKNFFGGASSGRDYDTETVESLEAPESIKDIILAKMSDVTKGIDSSKTWLNWALKLPYDKVSLDFKQEVDISHKASVQKFYLDSRKKLDDILYGLDEVKEQIMMIVMNMVVNNADTGAHIALRGPPGVGKTTIASAIAEILHLPFERISLGGSIDSTLLKGSDAVWKDSQPGAIVQALSRMGVSNGIIFLDELDKLSGMRGMQVQHALLHIADPSQNKDFRDSYLMGLPIDISRLWFIYAMNYDDTICDTLKDRLNIVDIPDYSSEEKKIIAKDYLFPSIAKQIDFPLECITITPKAINYLIKRYPGSGVRKLQGAIREILSRLSFSHRLGINSKKQRVKLGLSDKYIPMDELLELTPQLVQKLLGEDIKLVSESVQRMYL
jgi:ATP-dependent Lon protease